MSRWQPDSVAAELATIPVGLVRREVPLRDCSWWRIGGPADILVEPGAIDEVQTLLRFLSARQLPWAVIGGGCNLLFDDAGVRGVVIRIGRPLGQLAIDGERIVAGAGLGIPWLARGAANAGLAGLEHIVGIPGTVGGLVLMNGGSLRQGIGDHIERVTVVTREGERELLTREQCGFAYRHSALQGSGRIVMQAELRCPLGDRRAIRREMLAILLERRTRFPLKLPNCGSVFLNDPEIYAAFGAPGKVIEETGLKGLRSGAIEVSPLHANFMVNHGGGSSADVFALIRQVRAQVHDRTGRWLRCEVRYLAPDTRLLPAHEALEAGLPPHSSFSR